MGQRYSDRVSQSHLPIKQKSLQFVFSFIFLPLFLLPAAAWGQLPCTDEAGCFPATGNLASGRTVTASSVCTAGSEVLVFGTTTTFPCAPNSEHSPTGLSDSNNRTIWVSEIGGNPNVTLQLDFESSILFNRMTMVWGSARPQSMVLERSKDNGESWEVYRYYSASCNSDFGLPDTTVTPDSTFSTTDAICTSAESSLNPTSSGLVTFDTMQHLPPGTSAELSQAYRLATNLRVRFLSQFPDLSSSDSRLEYYAVAEWIVEGSCMCNGHASSCAPAPGETASAEKEVLAGCLCQHLTMGTHCEQCATGHNSLPWAPGTETEANVCQECMCNGHAADCQYDTELESAVCVNCTDGTVGNSCDRCLPQFYQNMDVLLSDPNICIACDCNPAGSLDGACDTDARCSCKANVDQVSATCDTCQVGYWNLSADNPLGCQACDCNSTGTVEDSNFTCDPLDGFCTCKEGVGGRQCDRCQSGSFGFIEIGCQACECNSIGTVEGTTCDPIDGACTCKEGVAGMRCDSCQSGYFFSGNECRRELIFGLDYLPFVDIPGDTAVYLEHNNNDDDCSDPVTVDGITFGSARQTVLYVCENGLISFGSAWDGSPAGVAAHTTFQFPLTDAGAYLVAPLWSDVDISDPLGTGEGEIFYQTFSNSGDELLSLVSGFVEYQYNVSFTGEWMLVAEWNNVHPIPQESDPRKNTYQAVIIMDGNQAYVVYTYQCGSLEWTETIHLGTLSTVGLNADGVYYENHPLSRTGNLAEIACQNNESGIPWSNVIYALNPTVLINRPPEHQIVNFLELENGTPLQLSCSAVLFGVTEGVLGWVYLDGISCVCNTSPSVGIPHCSTCEQTILTGSGDQSVINLTATLTIREVATPSYTCQIFNAVQALIDSATTTIQLQVPHPNISISAEGSGMFGEPYNLTCTVQQADISIPRAGVVTLIEWLADSRARDGDISQQPTSTDLEGAITSRTLSFSFLNAFRHNGVYVCQATFIDSSELFLLPPEIIGVKTVTVPPAVIAADNRTALLGDNVTLAFTAFAEIEKIAWHFQADGDTSVNSINITCDESILLDGTNSTLTLLCGFGNGYEFNLTVIGVTLEAAGSYILSVTSVNDASAQNSSTLTVQPFDITKCGSLCEIATIDEPEEQAERLAEMTSNTEELDEDDIATASFLLEDLTESAIVNREVMMDYLQTVDNVLRVDPGVILESQMQNQSSTRILYSLGNVTANVSLPGNSTSMVYTGITFGLNLLNVNSANFGGQNFSINLGSVEEATRSNRTSRIDPTVLRDMLTQDATANVEVSENLDFGQSSENLQRLVLSFYLRDSFFQVTNTTISSIVVGLESPNVIGTPSPATEQTSEESSLVPAVNFEFQVADIENSEEFEANCSNFSPGGNGGVGTWSSDNCREVTCPPGRENQTCCECYQLGHFGLILAPTPTILSEVFNNVLTVFSYIGAGLSLICLLLTLVTYLSSKKLRSGINGQLLLNYVVSLIGLYVFFITAGNILVYGKNTTTEVLCGINSALVQYFLLVYFGWTAAEALQLYYWKIRKGIETTGQHLGHHVLKLALVVWLVPLLIVGVSAGAGYRFYTNDVYCRAVQWPFWFALVLPCGLIFIFDWILFILIINVAYQRIKEHRIKNKAKVKKNIRNAVLLTTLFGLGWVFGLAATGFPGEDTEVLTFILQIFFCLIVGLQGVLLFLLQVVCERNVRKVWRGWYAKLTRKYRGFALQKPQQDKRKHPPPPRPAARDSTGQNLNLSLSQDSTMSPNTLSPRQQLAESLTITEGLETSGRHYAPTPANLNAQVQPLVFSISEEFVSSPLTDTSSVMDFDNLDLVNWV